MKLLIGMLFLTLYFPSVIFANEKKESLSVIDFDQHVTQQEDNLTVSQNIKNDKNTVNNKTEKTTSILNSNEFKSEKISYIPNIYLAGYAGSELVGQADLLAPVYFTNDRIFMVYGQGRYSGSKEESWEKETWMGSAGLLYRQIINNQVLGAYILSDYSQADSGHRYWTISPGLESLSQVWDFHLNGYIPIGDKYWKNEAWAQEFGNYSYVEFEEGTNNVYDHRLSYFEEVGTGGEAEIGRKIFKTENTLNLFPVACHGNR